MKFGGPQKGGVLQPPPPPLDLPLAVCQQAKWVWVLRLTKYIFCFKRDDVVRPSVPLVSHTLLGVRAGKCE